MWHGFKYLFRRHPLAVLSAAGAGIAFAGKQVVREGVERARDSSPSPETEAAVVPCSAPVAAPLLPEQAPAETLPGEHPGEEERQAFWNSLSPETRRELEALAAEHRKQQASP